MSIDVLVVTGGHPFEPDPFFAMSDAFDAVSWTGVSSPEPDHDVVVFYDMPGFTFTRDATEPVRFTPPSQQQRAVIDQLVAEGTGLVFLHHAIAGCPARDADGDLIGGRFHYLPRGDRPASGYLLDGEHTIEVVATDHPVCDGLPSTFSVTDELYCYPVDESSVTGRRRTATPTTDDHCRTRSGGPSAGGPTSIRAGRPRWRA